MWISRKRWRRINERIRKCEKVVNEQKKQTEQLVFEMTKRILREPEKLSEELKAREDTEAYVERIISH